MRQPIANQALVRRRAQPKRLEVDTALPTPSSLEASPSALSAHRSNLRLCCALLFGAMFNLTLVVAGLKEFILDDLGGTVGDASLFFSIETLAYILFAPVWGLLSDRTGKRRVWIVLGFVLSSALYGCYAFVQSIPTLLGLRFLQGACSVMGWSTVMALVLDNPNHRQRGRQMGWMGASLIFGVAVGAPVGGYFTRWLGPRGPLAVAAGLFLLLALGALALKDPPRPAQHSRVREILNALRSRPQLTIPYAFHFVDRLAVGLFIIIFPLYLDSLGASDPAVRGRYLSFFLLPFALLQVLTGRLTERTGPFPPLLLGSALYGAALCTVGVASLQMLWPVMLALGVLASFMFPPAMLLTARLATESTKASAMGGYNLAGSFGFALGPLLGTLVYSRGGFAAGFLICGLLEILLAAATGLWLLQRRDGQLGDVHMAEASPDRT